MELSDAKLTDLCEEIRGGADEVSACLAIGFSSSVLLSILEEGKNEQIHRDCGGRPHARAEAAYRAWLLVGQAKADARRFYQQQIKKAALQGEWKAAQWWLSKNNPNVFGSMGSGTAEALDAIDRKAVER